MIDLERFQENFSYLDNEVVVEIIDIFFSEFDERFSSLQENINQGDFDGLKFNAHSLKGVIANFMDPITIALSKKLDEKAKISDSQGLQAVYDELKSATIALKTELSALRNSYA